MLNANSDRFAFSMENLEPVKFSGESMRLELTFDKPIFRPPHKLGHPLNQLLKKDAMWQWDDKQIEAFQELKAAPLSVPRVAASQRIQAFHPHDGLEPQGDGSGAEPT